MQPLISVIMSIYNEEVEDIKKAIKSVFDQTYKNLELIIIIDNPEKYSEEFIRNISDDNRLIIATNEKNIGLAMSMNKAVTLAKGSIIARMDADDISYPERLEKEYQLMVDQDKDYVCTWFEFIDENGQVGEKKPKRYRNDNINKLLQYANTIHHPTVIMKKEMFEKVGGYRDFPCAQDYDLWLRFFSKGYKVGIVEEVLFQYRIRGNNTTSTKRVQQYYTQVYSRKLYYERKKTEEDTYSLDSYNKFLRENGVFDKEYVKRILEEFEKKGRMGKGYIIFLIIKYPFFRQYYKDAVQAKIADVLK